MFIYDLIIAPIEMIVGWVFYFFMNKFHGFGVIGAIFGVSIVINFLALPLYNIADSIQEKERLISKRLEYRVKRIKKAFKGDEQFMMLSTFYRQNGYHPLYALRSSLSILIEIPFFIAAYKFLSHCDALMGESWVVLKDLGKPDGLLSIAGFKVNVLPVIMTLINIVSGMIYTKGFSVREKLQLNIIAIIFLVLLYSSPSGLVFYWILNNIFSLCKNVVFKCKNPKKILHRVLSIIICLFVFLLFIKKGSIVKKLFVVCFAVIFIFLPKLIRVGSKFIDKRIISLTNQNLPDLSILIISGLGLSLLCGFVLPSSVIASSPTEFCYIGNTPNPMSYIWHSLTLFLGFFLFWPFVIYKMFDEKVKKIETVLFFIAFITALANAFLFKINISNISITLSFLDMSVIKNVNIINKVCPFIFTMLLFALFVIILCKNKVSFAKLFCVALCFAELGICITKYNKISRIYKENAAKVEKEISQDIEISPVYHLSKTKKNVVVLFLDRAINGLFYNSLSTLPELRNQFTGFTYYPNTVSFGTGTAMASPSMLGGYEYTPDKLNARNKELLSKKHREATLVLPTLFIKKGFDVTLSDPPCINYKWGVDYSGINNIDNLNVFSLNGKYRDKFLADNNIKLNDNMDKIIYKEMPFFVLVQIIYPALRNSLYNNLRSDKSDSNLIIEMNDSYLKSISDLYYMNELTDFDAEKEQYIFITNEVCHQPTFLKEDYTLPADINDSCWKNFKTVSNAVLINSQALTASLKFIGKWIDYLKENDVYDNTRIIIVADHGFNLPIEEFKNFSSKKFSSVSPAWYYPILLVKDFNSSGDIKVDNTFMTNADTLFIAKEGLGLENINPFTGNELKKEKSNGVDIYHCKIVETNVEYMADKTKFTLDKNEAYHVKENIFDENNWIPLKDLEKEGVKNE